MNHFIITGKKHQGKTKYAFALNSMLLSTGFKTGGFLSQGYFKNSIRDRFYIYSLISHKKHILAKYAAEGDFQFGNYGFYNTGFEYAFNEYDISLSSGKNIIFIDEIGKLELQGGGFYNIFSKMPVNASLITVCREDYTTDINNLFFNGSAEILNINTDLHINIKIINNMKVL